MASGLRFLVRGAETVSVRAEFGLLGWERRQSFSDRGLQSVGLEFCGAAGDAGCLLSAASRRSRAAVDSRNSLTSAGVRLSASFQGARYSQARRRAGTSRASASIAVGQAAGLRNGTVAGDWLAAADRL